jgi:hypothetical protein
MPAALYFTQPIIRTILPSLTGDSTPHLLHSCSALLYANYYKICMRISSIQNLVNSNAEKPGENP